MAEMTLKQKIDVWVRQQDNQMIGDNLAKILEEIVDNIGEIETIKTSLATKANIVEVDAFEDFAETDAYSKDDVVRHDGKLYIFTADKAAGEWDAESVSQTSVYALLSA